MSLANSVRFNPLSIAFIDPSINKLGLAIYRCTSTDGKALAHELTKSECHVDIDTSVPTDIRCRNMYRYVSAVIRENSCKKVYIEIPPDTIYDQHKLTKDQVIARAASICKLNAVTYSIFAHLVDVVPCHGILPAQWEVRKGPGGAKLWSLNYANLILRQNGIVRELREGTKDQNEADAITMGDIVIRKLANQAIVVK